MSFFFDVWTNEGFILASDVRLIEQVGGGPEKTDYHHKVMPSPYWPTGIRCAVAISGDDPDTCKAFFGEACGKKDTLREIALYFAAEWTGHFAGAAKYSAVHLVGYEKYPNFDEPVPQMWYWNTWSHDDVLIDEQLLRKHLSSFSEDIPFNNHLPHKVREHTGKFPSRVPEEEYALVKAFLLLNQPYFTWNGDTGFWRSASGVVSSGLNLLWRQKSSWSIGEASELTKYCLAFLANTAKLLPMSTVGLSPDGQFDILTVTPDRVDAEWAKLPVK